MTLLEPDVCEEVGGGNLFVAWAVAQAAAKVGEGLYNSINAMGATLRNYYGDDGALEIMAAGNMTA